MTFPVNGTRWCSQRENISISLTITISSWSSSNTAPLIISSPLIHSMWRDTFHILFIPLSKIQHCLCISFGSPLQSLPIRILAHTLQNLSYRIRKSCLSSFFILFRGFKPSFCSCRYKWVRGYGSEGYMARRGRRGLRGWSMRMRDGRVWESRPGRFWVWCHLAVGGRRPRTSNFGMVIVRNLAKFFGVGNRRIGPSEIGPVTNRIFTCREITTTQYNNTITFCSTRQA